MRFAAIGAAAAATAGALGYSVLSKSLSYIFPAERWGPGKGVILATSYRDIIFIVTALYLPVILLLERLMRSREPLKLRTVAFVWNLSLSLLSLLGVVTVLISQPRLFLTAMQPEKGFSAPVRVVISFFTLTKAIEFGDTLLLVLKKRSLSFLHVYHHLTVTLYCWHAQYINADFAHAFALMNLVVHSIMYFYFCLACCVPSGERKSSSNSNSNSSSSNSNSSSSNSNSNSNSSSNSSSNSNSSSSMKTLQSMLRKSRPFITLLQIFQMLIGVYLSFQGAIYLKHDPRQVLNARLALMMYASYAVLFIRLYCKSYLPRISSSRLLILFMLHSLAALGAFKLWCCSNRTELSIRLVAVAAVSLSLSLYNSSSNNNSKLVHLQLLFNWFSAISIRNQSTKDTPISHIPDATPGEMITTTEKIIMQDFPSRCLSISSTSAETATPSSPISSNDDVEPITPTPSETHNRNTAAAAEAAAAAAEAAAAAAAAKKGMLFEALGEEKQKQQQQMQQRHPMSLLYEFIQKDTSLRLDWVSLAAAAAGTTAPAVYGHLIGGDWGLGLCVFGMMRWALELHVAERLSVRP